jgi:hypothetical protein
MRILVLPSLAAALLAAFLTACPQAGTWARLSAPFGALGEHALLVVLPAAPPSWACLADLGLSLSWKGPDGGARSARAAPGSRLRIEVERGRPQAILARPSSFGGGLCPAGALYPEALAGRDAGAGEDELLLDWRGGYAASVALALEGGGVDPFGYDLYALVDGALRRSGDPWLVPALEAARRLAGGNFRIDAYKRSELVSVGLPGPGPWAPESPFAPPPTVESAAGASFSVSLPTGLWRFVGPGEELIVSVDAEGRAAMVRRLF